MAIASFLYPSVVNPSFDRCLEALKRGSAVVCSRRAWGRSSHVIPRPPKLARGNTYGVFKVMGREDGLSKCDGRTSHKIDAGFVTISVQSMKVEFSIVFAFSPISQQSDKKSIVIVDK